MTSTPPHRGKRLADQNWRDDSAKRFAKPFAVCSIFGHPSLRVSAWQPRGRLRRVRNSRGA
jgi:hypothetical protein